MDDFLKKVDDLLSSAEAKKKAEEKEMEEVKNLFQSLCQKAEAASRVSLVIVSEEAGAFRIAPNGEISFSDCLKRSSGKKWEWLNPTPIEEAKILLLNRKERFYSILSSALKNEADVEIE